MIVAGFGFRGAAPVAAFEALLGPYQPTHLAVLTRKAAHPAFCAFAQARGLPVVEVAEVAGIETPSHSARVEALFQTGSMCEALALGALSQGRLVLRRQTSQDGMVTMAIAEGAV